MWGGRMIPMAMYPDTRSSALRVSGSDMYQSMTSGILLP